jgi:dinuclear metal center YbgI/SA1388 family protein
MEKLAPLSLALPGDPVGLQLGNPELEINTVLVALDPDQKAVDKAAEVGADMLVTHHPLFYQKLSSIDESLPGGALIASAIRNRINIYSAHTNYDVTPQGVSFQLAETLGFKTGEAEILEVTGSEQLLKLVVFIPGSHEDIIRNALAGAGAGQIGRYSHCTFQAKGTGTFMPGEGTNPYIGKSGRLEKVEELRLETILPATFRSKVISALMEAHPYEEPAYDLYPLDLEGRKIGLGLIVELDQPLRIDQLEQLCRDRLNARSLRTMVSADKKYKRVALCGGSGGSLIDHAAGKGAEILISGDFGYHNLKYARSLSLALIDAGHGVTEQPGMAYLKKYLAESLDGDGYKTEVHIMDSAPDDWSLA